MPFHSFHLDLLGSAATQCPRVATDWSTCPFGPCCQVNPYLLKQSESWFYSWGSKLLCLASWHWACPPPFDFWLQVLFLHNSLEPQHFNISLHYLLTSLWYLNGPTFSLGGLPVPDSNCSYQMRTTPGSQILVTFLKMDMASPLDVVGCARQAVSLEEPNHSDTSLFVQKKTFCGHQVGLSCM